MDISVDYEIPERMRGKKVTLLPYRKDEMHHAEVNLTVPCGARYLIVQTVTPEEDISNDSSTVCQLIFYFNDKKEKAGDEYLENIIDTFSLDKRLERLFKKIPY